MIVVRHWLIDEIIADSGYARDSPNTRIPPSWRFLRNCSLQHENPAMQMKSNALDRHTVEVPAQASPVNDWNVETMNLSGCPRAGSPIAGEGVVQIPSLVELANEQIETGGQPKKFGNHEWPHRKRDNWTSTSMVSCSLWRSTSTYFHCLQLPIGCRDEFHWNPDN